MAKRVAVVCHQARLRLLLRLSLVTAGYEVAEWNTQGAPSDPRVDIVIVDLDSLGRHGGRDLRGALAMLAAWRVPTGAPVLFISVYPLDLRSLEQPGSYAALQPPFAPGALADRVRQLVVPQP